MKKVLIFLMLIVSMLSSCKQKKPELKQNNKSKPADINNISFNTKSAVSDKYWGSFQSNTDSTEYVYFANVFTDKVIRVFELSDSVCKGIIPLMPVLWHEKNGIENIDMVSLDTILVLGKFSNTLYYVNRKGKIWKKLQLDSVCNTKQSYELYTSPMNKFVINSDEIITRSYYFYDNDSIEKDFNNIEYVRLNRKNLWDTPMFIRFSNVFGDSINTAKGSYIYKYLYPDKPFSYFVEYGIYCLQDKYIYLTSYYSNLILKIDIYNFEIVEKYEINSDNTSIGVQPIPLGKEIRDYQQEYLDSMRRGGVIGRIFFNEKTECFYINVYIEQKDNEEIKSINDRKAALLIYDKLFNKIDEFVIDNSKYYKSFLNTKSGFYIQKKGEKTSALKNRKVSFERINISHEDLYPYNRIKKYLSENNSSINNVNTLFILTNNGTCMNCNRAFANFIEKYTSNPNVKIIVTEEGNNIDISPFLNAKNTILDFEEDFLNLDIVEGTSAILIKNEKIDTIINIKSTSINEQIDFIQNNYH